MAMFEHYILDGRLDIKQLISKRFQATHYKHDVLYAIVYIMDNWLEYWCGMRFMNN